MERSCCLLYFKLYVRLSKKNKNNTLNTQMSYKYIQNLVLVDNHQKLSQKTEVKVFASIGSVFKTDFNKTRWKKKAKFQIKL